MNKATARLRETARSVLRSGKAELLIGYGESGTGTVVPVFIRTAEDADRLVFDERCVHNLAVYLTRPEVRALGLPGIVVKGCDSRAVNVLIRESQVARDAVYLIGMDCPGTGKAVCLSCEQREPVVFDERIGWEGPVSPPEPVRDPVADLSPDARWEYWMEQFSRCIKCYACRQICPVCHCTRCLAEKNQPQWIDTSPHPRGNLKWNLVRAFHLAGRCVECGECERACPMNIPLTSLGIGMRSLIRDRFGSVPGMDGDTPAPLASFREDDREEFFL